MIRIITSLFALTICLGITVFVSRLSVPHTVFGSINLDTLTPPDFTIGSPDNSNLLAEFDPVQNQQTR